MATSSADDVPRSMEFLYDLHRLNVAVSRARAVSTVVASPALIRVQCKTPLQLLLANVICFLVRSDHTDWSDALTLSGFWADFSDYLIHFTRPTDSNDSVTVFLSILSQGCLRRSDRPSGAAKNLKILGDTQRCVSLTEVPPGAWDRLIIDRSSHGLAFSKPFIASKGGAPVWYLEKDSPVQRIAFGLFNTAQSRDPEHPIWRLTPFIDFPGSYPSGTYRYEWEREWRVPGDLVYSTRDV